LKELGCTHIIATTAVGSLKEEIAPGHLVFPDQFIDWTRHRDTTFHDKHEVVHTSMAEPFDNKLRTLLNQTAQELQIPYHGKGTVITIEGPRFSTKAESFLFRSMNADIINMSTVPECALANEIKLPYAAIAMSTDYDCWKENLEPVTFEEILAVMKANADKVKILLMEVIKKVE
jgi:5'-methylthioadenosine phosphorylase